MKTFVVVLLSFSACQVFAQGGPTAPPPPPPLTPLGIPPQPAGNPVTTAKVNLGKSLFWDEQLSSTRSVACGTCHRSGAGGSDPRSVPGSRRSINPGADAIFGTADDVTGSRGVPGNRANGGFIWSDTYGYQEQVTGRKAPSYINAAYYRSLFWDGRANQTFTDPASGAIVLQGGAALESQVLGPPVSAAEMGHDGRTWTDVVVRVIASRPLALSPRIPLALDGWIAGRGYPQLFGEAFGSTNVTAALIAMAIASYERSAYSDQTPLDAQLAGSNVLTAAESAGFNLFGQLGCAVCHAGNIFTDDRFHYIGVRPNTEDVGRYAFTTNPADLGAMRTPGLRNVGLRAPYMHTGRLRSLEDVVAFYNRGGDFAGTNKDPLIRPLNLTPAQQSNLVAFLRGALTDPRVAAGSGPFERPLLSTESSRFVRSETNGVAGTGGAVPRIGIVAPAVAGNTAFSVGVSAALGGSQAVLAIGTYDPALDGQVPGTAALVCTNVVLEGDGPEGHGQVTIAIPADTGLVGTNLVGRWFIYDSAAPGGVALSSAFYFRIFREGAQVGVAFTRDATGLPAISFEGTLRSATNLQGTFVDEWETTSPAPLTGDASQRFFYAW